MIKNYYYLILGILTILFSVTHAMNGLATVLPVIDSSNVDLATKTTVFYVWHIISVENLVFGIAFILMSLVRDHSKVRFTAWLLAVIMVARWGVIFGSVVYKNPASVTDNLLDFIVIILYVILIALGTRKKEKLPV
jgi:hypothetical protein